MIMKQYTRVYAPIDLDAIRFNMESMKRNLAPEREFWALARLTAMAMGQCLRL